MNKFKALGSKFILCNKCVDIWQVGIKKCSGILQLHIGREASDTIMYKQPRREPCYAGSHYLPELGTSWCSSKFQFPTKCKYFLQSPFQFWLEPRDMQESRDACLPVKEVYINVVLQLIKMSPSIDTLSNGQPVSTIVNAQTKEVMVSYYSVCNATLYSLCISTV